MIAGYRQQQRAAQPRTAAKRSRRRATSTGAAVGSAVRTGESESANGGVHPADHLPGGSKADPNRAAPTSRSCTTPIRAASPTRPARPGRRAAAAGYCGSTKLLLGLAFRPHVARVVGAWWGGIQEVADVQAAHGQQGGGLAASPVLADVFSGLSRSRTGRVSFSRLRRWRGYGGASTASAIHLNRSCRWIPTNPPTSTRLASARPSATNSRATTSSSSTPARSRPAARSGRRREGDEVRSFSSHSQVSLSPPAKERFIAQPVKHQNRHLRFWQLGGRRRTPGSD